VPWYIHAGVFLVAVIIAVPIIMIFNLPIGAKFFIVWPLYYIGLKIVKNQRQEPPKEPEIAATVAQPLKKEASSIDNTIFNEICHQVFEPQDYIFDSIIKAKLLTPAELGKIESHFWIFRYIMLKRLILGAFEQSLQIRIALSKLDDEINNRIGKEAFVEVLEHARRLENYIDSLVNENGDNLYLELSKLYLEIAGLSKDDIFGRTGELTNSQGESYPVSAIDFFGFIFHSQMEDIIKAIEELKGYVNRNK
jgi:hypothetical protein